MVFELLERILNEFAVSTLVHETEKDYKIASPPLTQLIHFRLALVRSHRAMFPEYNS